MIRIAFPHRCASQCSIWGAPQRRQSSLGPPRWTPRHRLRREAAFAQEALRGEHRLGCDDVLETRRERTDGTARNLCVGFVGGLYSRCRSFRGPARNESSHPNDSSLAVASDGVRSQVTASDRDHHRTSASPSVANAAVRAVPQRSRLLPPSSGPTTRAGKRRARCPRAAHRRPRYVRRGIAPRAPARLLHRLSARVLLRTRTICRQTRGTLRHAPAPRVIEECKQQCQRRHQAGYFAR